MRLLIAGADIVTVSGLAAHLTDCGHISLFARNGRECRAALQSFIPDLLIMEFDILWGGSDGVLDAMNGDPRLREVPIVLFAECYKQAEFSENPRIIASLTKPFQPNQLSRLNSLLENMSATRAELVY
jgi:CheY-like chemotaxis protein